MDSIPFIEQMKKERDPNVLLTVAFLFEQTARELRQRAAELDATPKADPPPPADTATNRRLRDN